MFIGSLVISHAASMTADFAALFGAKLPPSSTWSTKQIKSICTSLLIVSFFNKLCIAIMETTDYIFYRFQQVWFLYKDHIIALWFTCIVLDVMITKEIIIALTDASIKDWKCTDEVLLADIVVPCHCIQSFQHELECKQ